ncbi:MAG: T9SS type A sorting domain-containing protein [Candidatus Eisenbacteria bacterium]|nr:T9SS type A sorting domain-containing protein [Candidatus Eisenbacteria bacterium]
MSTRTYVTSGTLALVALLVATVARSAVQYDPILEWNGPYFNVANGNDQPQAVDNPVVDFPFTAPNAVVAREHATGGRDVVYVLDSGNNRIQAFEVNGTYVYTDEGDFTYQAGGTSAASEWDTDSINLAEWVAVSTQWVVPYSETLTVDGDAWTRVASLTGYVAADKVYTITYSDASNAPEILAPATSFDADTEFDIRYLVSDNQTAATAAFGIGDVDYGTGAADPPVLTEITEASGGPTSFETLRAMALIQDEQTATSDDIFVIDAADATDKLFYYIVTVAGAVSAGETYEDALSTPWDVAVARSGASTRATVTLDDTGPFDTAGTVTDDSQVTGHTYTATVAGANVTITDNTTGRVLLDTAAWADLDDPYLGIPGISLDINAAIGVTNTIATTKAGIGRYVFVADTGNDRIKVMGAPDVASIAGGWLAADDRTVVAQPTATGTIGDDATEDYSESTPGTVTEDLVFWTATSPIAEGTLSTITFDPNGTPVEWTRIDDISTAGPTDKVYTVDWKNGMIRFGDGIHGALPDASTDFEYSYSTTPDVLRYGTSGTGNGRFSGPKGVAARYNSAIDAYDVYVADTGNSRVQKLRFYPADATLGTDARMEFVTSWNEVSSTSDVLSGPTDVVVEAANGEVWVAVVDGGNDRVVIYEDTAASDTNDSTAPTYDSALGSTGSDFGEYAEVAGVAALANGNDLDWFVVDSQRGVVTKYEESPTPTLAVTWTGLPDCFPPTGSYTISWASTNAPDGGYVDIFYDTASTFDEDTATLCFESESIAASATSATWVFADTPSGTPADGSYYIYVRMYNASGNVVASDATTSSELLCIDSSLLPTLAPLDEIDGDTTLYMQNGLERVVQLIVQYPDSVMSVGFDGTFDPTVVEIVDITQGTAFDGIGATFIQFQQTFDNVNGTFAVLSSALDAPTGLTGNGPHLVANVLLKAKANAIDETNRFNTSTLSIDNSETYMVDVNGEQPSSPTVSNMTIQIGYLGDIAGASSTGASVPNMTPEPDGLINFNDQMIFAIGWNGANNVRDQISDLGPITGTAPTVFSVPDQEWDVDDILAFTTMFSWAAENGFVNSGSGRPALGAPVFVNGPTSFADEVPGSAYAYAETQMDNVVPGSLFDVALVGRNLEDMNGALLSLGFDASQVELVDARAGELFESAQGRLFFERNGEGWVELSANRLDPGHAGVSGDGVLAHLTFRMKTVATNPIDLSYDLRSSQNEVLSRGTAGTTPIEKLGATLALYAPSPNPVSAGSQIVFAIPASGAVSLDVFDTMGRKVRTLAEGEFDAGYHVVSFDGRSDEHTLLPAGVYFYRLDSEGKDMTKKLVIAR